MKTFGMLHGQRILVVGDSGDIGLALVERLLAEGATVVATVHRQTSRLVVRFPDGTPGLTVEGLDVTAEDSVQEAVRKITAGGGELSALIYNAGIIRDGPVLGMEDEDWLEVIGANLTGAFRVGRAFGKLCFRRKARRMLFVSSVAGRQVGRGQANYAAAEVAALAAHLLVPDLTYMTGQTVSLDGGFNL